MIRRVSREPATLQNPAPTQKARSANTQIIGDQGRSDGVPYIGIYTPKISNRFVHVWDINICFEIAMTSYNVYPPNQIPGYDHVGDPYDVCLCRLN